MARGFWGNSPGQKRSAAGEAQGQQEAKDKGQGLKATNNVSVACHLAGITRATAYETRASDKEFEAQWVEALDVGCDLM